MKSNLFTNGETELSQAQLDLISGDQGKLFQPYECCIC